MGRWSVTASSSDQSLIADGSLSLVDGGSGNWTIQATPLSNQHGTATITLTVDDGTTTTVETFDVTVTPVVDLTSANDSFSTDEDVVLNADVSGNDSTTSGGSLSYAVDTDVSHGSLTLNPNGSFTYTPTGDYAGPDSFSYTVTDAASGESATRSVTLTVDAVNDEPSFSAPGNQSVGLRVGCAYGRGFCLGAARWWRRRGGSDLQLQRCERQQRAV